MKFTLLAALIKTIPFKLVAWRNRSIKQSHIHSPRPHPQPHLSDITVEPTTNHPAEAVLTERRPTKKLLTSLYPFVCSEFVQVESLCENSRLGKTDGYRLG
jgi:hypothetical protein